MSTLKRQMLSKMAAAAIPVGIAAVFAFQASASAAPDFAIGQSSSVVRLAAAKPAASAHVRKHHRKHLPARLRAYYWALSQKGHPYEWGGTGPGYDCSGLVMMAYRHVGIHLPRTTYEMLASPLLVRVTHPHRGDLAFYGSGHVELFKKWGYTFGAHDYSSPVSLVHYGWGWKPTAFYRVRVRHHRRHRR
jgi:cell wall-associated NlpC family hydrolase